jgi:hypothetical protein
MPAELQLLHYIERFGVQAVTGRLVLGAGELRRMTAAENIVRWYRERARAENWAAWAAEHTWESRILNDIMKSIEDDEQDDGG